MQNKFDKHSKYAAMIITGVVISLFQLRVQGQPFSLVELEGKQYFLTVKLSVCLNHHLLS